MSSSAPPTDLYQLFTGPLEALGLRYLVSGSVASILYGEPRVTHDIDIDMAMVDRWVERLDLAEAWVAARREQR